MDKSTKATTPITPANPTQPPATSVSSSQQPTSSVAPTLAPAAVYPMVGSSSYPQSYWDEASAPPEPSKPSVPSQRPASTGRTSVTSSAKTPNRLAQLLERIEQLLKNYDKEHVGFLKALNFESDELRKLRGYLKIAKDEKLTQKLSTFRAFSLVQQIAELCVKLAKVAADSDSYPVAQGVIDAFPQYAEFAKLDKSQNPYNYFMDCFLQERSFQPYLSLRALAASSLRLDPNRAYQQKLDTSFQTWYLPAAHKDIFRAMLVTAIFNNIYMAAHFVVLYRSSYDFAIAREIVYEERSAREMRWSKTNGAAVIQAVDIWFDNNMGTLRLHDTTDPTETTRKQQLFFANFKLAFKQRHESGSTSNEIDPHHVISALDYAATSLTWPYDYRARLIQRVINLLLTKYVDADGAKLMKQMIRYASFDFYLDWEKYSHQRHIQPGLEDLFLAQVIQQLDILCAKRNPKKICDKDIHTALNSAAQALQVLHWPLAATLSSVTSGVSPQREMEMIDRLPLKLNEAARAVFNKRSDTSIIDGWIRELLPQHVDSAKYIRRVQGLDPAQWELVSNFKSLLTIFGRGSNFVDKDIIGRALFRAAELVHLQPQSVLANDLTLPMAPSCSSSHEKEPDALRLAADTSFQPSAPSKEDVMALSEAEDLDDASCKPHNTDNASAPFLPTSAALAEQASVPSGLTGTSSPGMFAAPVASEPYFPPPLAFPEDFDFKGFEKAHPRYVCPITQEVMTQPASIAGGETVERNAAKTWYQTHDTHPVHRSAIAHKCIDPNWNLRECMERDIAIYHAQIQMAKAQVAALQTAERQVDEVQLSEMQIPEASVADVLIAETQILEASIPHPPSSDNYADASVPAHDVIDAGAASEHKVVHEDAATVSYMLLFPPVPKDPVLIFPGVPANAIPGAHVSSQSQVPSSSPTVAEPEAEGLRC